MTEPGRGLRFDIYERIHLAEDSIGISELHEAELIPHIQVIKQNDQAVLRGNLLLTGQYIGEDANDKRTLEHLIPVEITLPMSRINRIEDILVEIENFDVELLSTRNLNVTGVLSLHGIELSMEAGQTAKVSAYNEEEAEASAQIASNDTGTNVTLNEPWQRDEEVTFAYQQPIVARSEFDHLQSQQFQNQQFQNQQFENQHQQQTPSIEDREWIEKAYISQIPQPQQHAQDESEFEQPINAFTNPNYDPPQNPYGADSRTLYEPFEQPSVPSHYEEPPRYDQPAEPVWQPPVYEAPPMSTSYFAPSDYYSDLDARHEPQDEPKELRVAFGSKREQEPVESEQSYGIKSLLRPVSAQDGQQPANAEPSRDQVSRLDALEWRKLFLREDGDQQEFRKLKMVIVQKEESLDEIARRYGVQQRELQHYNRLNTEDVQTGQILYIPR